MIKRRWLDHIVMNATSSAAVQAEEFGPAAGFSARAIMREMVEMLLFGLLILDRAGQARPAVKSQDVTCSFRSVFFSSKKKTTCSPKYLFSLVKMDCTLAMMTCKIDSSAADTDKK